MKRLGVGFIGSGFNARFHILGWRGVRDADVRGVWSPNAKNAASAAAYARELDVGDAKAFKSIAAMVADPGDRRDLDLAARTRRASRMSRRSSTRSRAGAASSRASRARNRSRAMWPRRSTCAISRSKRGIATGYLENQVFAPQVETGHSLLWARGAATTGRPYLARAAEEHSGPHMPWFWRGELQGGGVLNDMMCHSALVVRHLLTEPGEPLVDVKPAQDHRAHREPQVDAAGVREAAARGDGQGRGLHEGARRGLREHDDRVRDGGRTHGDRRGDDVVELRRAGLRLSAELLGPEYSMSWNTLDSGLKLFFSREVRGKSGEDLVEKQNAEIGLMPVVANEAVAYGYEAEDRHFVRAFLGKEEPRLTFDDGLEVVRMLMAAYMSAEQGKTLDFPPKGLDAFVPAVAKGEWKG